MAWTRIDDGFRTNVKIRKAGPDGVLLYLYGLIYCNTSLTDGYIDDVFLPQIYADAFCRTPKITTQKLVDCGLWIRVEGGYQINDFLEYNFTKEEIEKRRQAKVEAGRRGGKASVGSKIEADRKPKYEADAQADAQAKFNPIPISLKDTTTPPYPPESDPKFEALFSAYEKQFGKPPKVDSEEIAIVDEMINDGISDIEFVAAIREMDEKGYACPAISSARQWIMNNRMKTERKAKAKSRAPVREVPDRYHIPGYVPDTSNEIVIHD